MPIAYVTDVEGMWERLVGFAGRNRWVTLDPAGRLVVTAGATFVFGGDAIDRGPAGRRVVATLLDAKRRYPDRVVLLAGNRDINKLRLATELRGRPPRGAPADAPRGELLRWIFAHTMGARTAFEHRKAELPGSPSDDEVVDSFLEDVAPGGDLAAYLGACQLAYRAGNTLFVHGAVTDESLGTVPGRARLGDVDSWVAALNDWYRTQVEAYLTGAPDDAWAPLVAYQAPVPGTRANQGSVVYGRLTDDNNTPYLPSPSVIDALRKDGIDRLVVGHTPSGDVPSLLRCGPFELVNGDTSYARLAEGAGMVIDDAQLTITGAAKLDDGRVVELSFVSVLTDAVSPVGRRLETTGQLVKAPLSDEQFLLYRCGPGYLVEQVVEPLGNRALGWPHRP